MIKTHLPSIFLHSGESNKSTSQKGTLSNSLNTRKITFSGLSNNHLAKEFENYNFTNLETTFLEGDLIGQNTYLLTSMLLKRGFTSTGIKNQSTNSLKTVFIFSPGKEKSGNILSRTTYYFSDFEKKSRFVTLLKKLVYTILGYLSTQIIFLVYQLRHLSHLITWSYFCHILIFWGFF